MASLSIRPVRALPVLRLAPEPLALALAVQLAPGRERLRQVEL